TSTSRLASLPSGTIDGRGRHPCSTLPIPELPPDALLVQPDVLVAPVVVDTVVVQHETLHVGLPAGGHAVIKDDWTRQVLGQPALDLPDDLLALLPVQF